MSGNRSPLLVLFDIDGTLIDTAGAGRRAIFKAFTTVLAPDGLEQVLAAVRFAGLTDQRIFRAVAEGLGLGDYEAVRPRIEAAYFDALTAEMARDAPRRRVLPGVETLLDALAVRSHVVLGLLTGNFERGARIKLEPFGLNRHFAGGGFGSDAAERREVARIAVASMQTLTGARFDTDRVVVVGDTEHDVDCAVANGYRALAVDTGWGHREAMERLEPDLLLPDLTELPRLLDFLGLDRDGTEKPA